MNIRRHGITLIYAATLLTGAASARADPPLGEPPPAELHPRYALIATVPPEPPTAVVRMRSRALLSGGVFVSLLGVGSIAAGGWFFNQRMTAEMGSGAQISGTVFIANGLALVGGGITMMVIGGRTLTLQASASLSVRPAVSIGPASGAFWISF